MNRVRDRLRGDGAHAIVVAVFNGSHTQDEDQRQGRGDRAERRDCRNQLKDQEDKKVEIGSSHELFEQIPWQEGEQGVFRGGDAVVLKQQ